MTLTGSMMSARNLERSLNQVESLATAHFADKADVRIAGYPPLYSRVISYISRAQVQSFLIAIVLIFMLFWIFIRDIRQALLASIACTSAPKR